MGVLSYANITRIEFLEIRIGGVGGFILEFGYGSKIMRIGFVVVL